MEANQSASDYNSLNEIEDLRVERLPEVADKQLAAKKLLKVIILGDTGVGKSCILTRLTKDRFDTEHNVTVGVDFGSCCIKVEDSFLKLQIWDTAGQESFRSITKIFYRAAHAVFLCYSINRRETFDNLGNWLKEVQEQCYPDVMIFMVGTKQDLESEREVSRESALRFQRENGIKYWAETSSKSGDNIESLFLDASKFLYRQLQNQETTSQGSPTNSHDDRSRSASGSQYNDMPASNFNTGPKQGERRNSNEDNIVLRPEEMDFPIQNKKGCKC